MRTPILLIICLFLLPLSSPSSDLPDNDPSFWSDFLSRQDLVWDRLSDEWGNGAFLGNGMLGAMIYKDNPQTLRWELGRNDVITHTLLPGVDWTVPRALIGDFLLCPAGQIQSETMRLDLWNAEARGQIKTDKGEILWRSFVHSDTMVLVVEIQTQGDERAASFQWRPQHGISPGLACMTEDKRLEAMEKHRDLLPPEPQRADQQDVQASVQELRPQGEFAVAWREERTSPNHCVFFITVANSFPDRTATPAAVETIRQAAQTGLASLEISHRAWWHAYYPESFLSLSDPYWDKFYWIQMYKLASATRADRMLIDNQGPWLPRSPWAGVWWNLNVQLSYSPVYAANRLDLGESLCRTLDQNMENLIQNAPKAFQSDSASIGRCTSFDCRNPMPFSPEMGNLTWACHNYWRQYRYSMEDGMLRDRLYPLLRRSVNVYLHVLKQEGDGKLHLPSTQSPEYDDLRAVKDCNYDLALLRWGCQTLLETCDRLKIQDPLRKEWRRVLRDLTPPPTDENGLMVGSDTPFAKSHRHYSHLLSIFPLHILSPDEPDELALIDRSYKHWIGLEGALAGYSYTGACSIAAILGRGDEALGYLEKFKPFLQPNTMYVEAGPVIETPLSCAESLHNMVLQSWGDTIKIFPAVPSSWKRVAFRDLRAEGAFLVSGLREDGATRFIRIRSLAGEPCQVKTDLAGSLEDGTLQVVSEKNIKVKAEKDGLLRIHLSKGEEVLLRTSWGEHE